MGTPAEEHCIERHSAPRGLVAGHLGWRILKLSQVTIELGEVKFELKKS